MSDAPHVRPNAMADGEAAATSVAPETLSPRLLEQLTERVYRLFVSEVVRERERRGLSSGRWR
jgi:hypothetical protein